MANSKKTTKRKTPSKSKLDITTRIRIDNDRLNDFDSLDTSFLEGRVEQKAKKDKKYKKKLLTSKNKKSIDLSIITNILSVLVLLGIIVGIVFLFFNNASTSNKKVKREKPVVEEIKIDDNYLFVGDFNTERLDFNELDYHYVKVSGDGLKTSDLLENITDYIYHYNPSIVFIELGINDLNSGVNEADITTTLSEVIDGIKENRKYAKIYIESIYPINNTIEGYDPNILSSDLDNNKISSLNKLLEDLSKDKKVGFINIYDKLIEEGNLNTKYTDNGIYLNEEGYRKVLNLLQKEIDKENAKGN